jgi:hypothetical protein
MTTYRKRRPYRKAQTYDGAEVVPAVVVPNNHGGTGLRWNPATEATRGTMTCWDGQPAAHHADVVAPFDAIAPHDCARQVPFGSMAAHNDPLDAPWSPIAPHERDAGVPWLPMDAHAVSPNAPWGDLQGRHAKPHAAPFGQITPHDVLLSAPWRRLVARAVSQSALWRSIIARGAYVAVPWGPAAARHGGVRIDWPVEPNPPPGTKTVPILPVYVMLPTLTAVRLPERTPLPLLSVSLQCDVGSWAWTFTAPMSASARDLIDLASGAPPEIEIAIKGYVWTFLVDGVDDNRRFGSRTLTLRGRSLSAELAEPYALPRTFTQNAARTIAQLAGDELEDRGWTLVWDAPDYLVPGGTFGYQDLAPMDAIAQLATAIGASVFSAPAAKTLTVSPNYPTSPWAWPAGAPWAILPASILTDGDSSWQGGTNADGVYVYAENAASGALVKIAGTDGSAQLPMVVDRLMVHADAQRERGRNELAAAGRKARVGRTIPLFPSPAPAGQPDLGVVPLGALVQVEDTDEVWRGQVMGVRIDAQRNGTALSVRQHLTLERQYR